MQMVLPQSPYPLPIAGIKYLIYPTGIGQPMRLVGIFSLPLAVINPIILSSLFTECIDSAALLDASILVHSIERREVIMWLISTRALNKVGPSICVFSASIDRIMHDTGLIVFSRVVEMDGMPVAC